MRRSIGLFVLCGLVLPLVIVANASAQGATLQLTPQSGPPGTVINVAGAGFSAVAGAVGPVQIRFSTRDAEVVRTANPDSQFRISTSFPIPAGMAPGEYLLLGTQITTRGRHVFGTPARAKLRVTASAKGAAAAAAGRGGGPPTVLLGTATLALILLAGGALAVRRRRTPRLPLGGSPTHSVS